MTDSDINDVRTMKDFRGVSFSKYKKGDVICELIKSIQNDSIEPALYWAGELICSGHYIDLWDTIILYMSRHIHIGNPKLPIYINMRFANFKDILNNGYTNNELLMRNNEKVRTIFAEIIYILCNSKQKHSYQPIKIKTSEFDLTNIKSKLKAPNSAYATDHFFKEDPKEIYIAINELCYHVIKSKDLMQACYWIEWILLFESECGKKKNDLVCERREWAPVNDKDQMMVIWIIWDVLLKNCNTNKLSHKILSNLLELFSVKFSKTVVRKRKYIIYFALSIIIDPYSDKINIIDDNKQYKLILSNLNKVYKEIKKNEDSPNTDYLFSGKSENNTENSIEKMNILNNVENFIPRI